VEVLLTRGRKGGPKDLRHNDFIRLIFKDGSEKHAILIKDPTEVNVEQDTELRVVPVEDNHFETISIDEIKEVIVIARDALEAFVTFSRLYLKHRELVDAINKFKTLFDTAVE
jgi:hypothetical protein